MLEQLIEKESGLCREAIKNGDVAWAWLHGMLAAFYAFIIMENDGIVFDGRWDAKFAFVGSKSP